MLQTDATVKLGNILFLFVSSAEYSLPSADALCRSTRQMRGL